MKGTLKIWLATIKKTDTIISSLRISFNLPVFQVTMNVIIITMLMISSIGMVNIMIIASEVPISAIENQYRVRRITILL